MNIYICGVPKCGKTTLARNLKKELSDYNLIVSESIRNGFQKMDAEHYKEWGNKNSELRKENFPIFVFEFLKWNTHFSGCNNIVDLALIDINTVIENKNEDDIVICLGFGLNKSNEEILTFIRNRENDNDYTKEYSDDKLLAIWGNISDIDKNNIKVCNENSIRYFDVINEFDIDKEILKEIVK